LPLRESSETRVRRTQANPWARPGAYVQLPRQLASRTPWSLCRGEKPVSADGGFAKPTQQSPPRSGGLCRISGALYAAFFSCLALNRAHLARCAAAIFRRAEADRMRFAGALAAVFADKVVLDSRHFVHRAFCARAIRLRAAADIVRLAWAPLRAVVEVLRPASPSIAEIASSNCLACFCTCLCSSRSS
jgi:hypothetical protein